MAVLFFITSCFQYQMILVLMCQFLIFEHPSLHFIQIVAFSTPSWRSTHGYCPSNYFAEGDHHAGIIYCTMTARWSFLLGHFIDYPIQCTKNLRWFGKFLQKVVENERSSDWWSGLFALGKNQHTVVIIVWKREERETTEKEDEEDGLS